MSVAANPHDQLNDALETMRDYRLAFDEDLQFVNSGDAHAWWVTEGALLLHRYAGRPAPRPQFAPVVGHAMRESATVASDSGASYGGDNIYYHWAEKIGRGGVAAPTPERLTRPVVYDGGAYVGLIPNPPTRISLRQTTGRKVVVTWVYNPLDQQVAPTSFEVFSNGGSGAVDLVTPIGSADYVAGKYIYRWVSDPIAAGTEVAITARAKAASGAYSLLPRQADGYQGPAQQYGSIELYEVPKILVVEQSLTAPVAPVFA